MVSEDFRNVKMAAEEILSKVMASQGGLSSAGGVLGEELMWGILNTSVQLLSSESQMRARAGKQRDGCPHLASAVYQASRYILSCRVDVAIPMLQIRKQRHR